MHVRTHERTHEDAPHASPKIQTNQLLAPNANYTTLYHRFPRRRSSFVVRRPSFVGRRPSSVVRRSSFVVRRSSFVVASFSAFFSPRRHTLKVQ